MHGTAMPPTFFPGGTMPLPDSGRIRDFLQSLQFLRCSPNTWSIIAPYEPTDGDTALVISADEPKLGTYDEEGVVVLTDGRLVHEVPRGIVVGEVHFRKKYVRHLPSL